MNGDLLLTMLAGYVVFGFLLGLLMGTCFVRTGHSSIEFKDVPMLVVASMLILGLPIFVGIGLTFTKEEE